MPGIVALCRPEQTAEGAGVNVVIMMKVTSFCGCFLALYVATLNAQAPGTASPAGQAPAGQQPTGPAPTNPAQPNPAQTNPAPTSPAPTSPTPASQEPATQTPEAPKPTSLVPTTPPPVRIPPQQHLAEARRILDGVSDKSFPDEGRKIFAQLQKDMSGLVSNFGSAEPKASVWMTNMYDVERSLALLIGGGNGLTPIPIGDKGKISKVEPADPATREALQEVRTRVELFYDSATTGLNTTTSPAPAP
jgi:hypothetical protein